MSASHLSAVVRVRQAGQAVAGADRGPVSERTGLSYSDGREQRHPGDPDPGQ